MAKFLGKHLRQDDRVKPEPPVKAEAESSDDSDDSDGGGKRKKKSGKGKKGKAGGGGGGGGGGLNKEVNWGEDMAAFLGTGHMSRPQVSGLVGGCMWFDECALY